MIFAMTALVRMPSFTATCCGREFRSQPDVIDTVGQDLGRQAAGGLLRKMPLVGSAVADNVTGEDPRYSYKMTPAQLERPGNRCRCTSANAPPAPRIVCLSDFDAQAGFCQEDSPRTDEIAEARGAQAGAALKGFAAPLGWVRWWARSRRRPRPPNAPARRWRAAPRTAPWLPPAPSSARNAARPWCSPPGRHLPEVRRGYPRRQVLPGVRHQN